METLIRRFRRGTLTVASVLALALCGASPAWAELKVGDSVPEATIKDGDNKPATIPDLGSKVILVLYTDPDEANQNDEFADRVKAIELDKSQFRSVGIANMKDAPAKPNWIIRSIVRGKIKKYNVTILTDDALLLKSQWNLGECNNLSVVILIDKDKKVRFFKKGKLAKADQDEALKLMCELTGGSFDGNQCKK